MHPSRAGGLVVFFFMTCTTLHANGSTLLPNTSGIDGQLTANLKVDNFFSLWLVFNNDDVEMSGGLEVGVPLQAVRDVTAQLPPPPAVQSAKRKLAATGDGAMAPETEETRKLTNIQLQRLVLLEQLKVARLQQQYFSAKLKDRALPGPAFVQENEKTFEIL